MTAHATTMAGQNASVADSSSVLATLERLIDQGDDVVRCAAARTLGTIGGARAAALLASLLLDEDPDLRADAMAGLAGCAGPDQAEAIRNSLLGDPVGDVKIAAIKALARIEDQAALPHLRALATDRCEAEVNWEDDGGWDEWLDVQIAAIDALATLGIEDAIGDLLEARADEMGQDLDTVVFGALARLPGEGQRRLLELARAGAPTSRRRAIAALAKADPDSLAMLVDDLAADPSAELRTIAVQAMGADHPLAGKLLVEDPDAAVRLACVGAFAARGDLLVNALADGDETVRAAAIDALMALGPHRPRLPDLEANARAWLNVGNAALAASAAAALPVLSGPNSERVLSGVATDDDCPAAVRVAAVRALGRLATESVPDTLRKLIADPMRQVRAAALTALTGLAEKGSGDVAPAALRILTEAIEGRIEPAAGRRKLSSLAMSADLPPREDEKRQRVRITEDGDIIREDDDESDENAADRPVVSTLESIQAAERPSTAPVTQGDSDEQVQGNKSARRRVAVGGPDEFGDDIRIIAMAVAGTLPDAAIATALVSVLQSDDDALRFSAIQALEKRGAEASLDEAARERIEGLLADEDARIRGAAIQMLASLPDATIDLTVFVDDPDTLIRASAVAAIAVSDPAVAIARMDDTAAPVRNAAALALARHGSTEDLGRGVRICLEAGYGDTIRTLAEATPAVSAELIGALAEADLRQRAQIAALEGLAVPVAVA